MVGARIAKSTMSGIKILQSASHDNAKIVQIIGQLVHKELMDRNLAIFSMDGYHSVGEKVIDSEGNTFTIADVSNGVATLVDETGETSSAGVSSGAAWRLRGVEL